MTPQKGQKYKALKILSVTGITSFAAPVSGSFSATLSPGDVLEIVNDPPPRATAVYARPLDYPAFEKRFVSEADRTSPIYGGYALVLDFRVLSTHFEQLS
ncbi:hypothetical protein [Synechocystis sp. LKSZ1]|uniref:hypothetical protein n=1 Tax=Synechocystis sp. LKSZ1 TaxID=3144951 RepID=UPI00336BE614